MSAVRTVTTALLQQVGKRQPPNRTIGNTVLYACRMNPSDVDFFDTMLTDIGIDPTDTREGTEDPVGLGNAAAAAIIAARSNDGAVISVQCHSTSRLACKLMRFQCTFLKFTSLSQVYTSCSIWLNPDGRFAGKAGQRFLVQDWLQLCRFQPAGD